MKKNFYAGLFQLMTIVSIILSLFMISCDNFSSNSSEDKEDASQTELKNGEDEIKSGTVEMEKMETKEENEIASPEINKNPDQMPEYPGGEEALATYLRENIVYPDQAKKDKVEGKVYVKFAVQPDGSVTQVEVLKGISPECDAEAARVVREMPNWNPGYKDDIPVIVEYTLPISFVLE